MSARIVTFVLANEWQDEVDYALSDSSIKRTAFHEVCELLFGPMHDMAMSRTMFETDLVTETHRIIRILENTVYEKYI